MTEDGRVTGFIIERISDARHATPEDLTICQTKLSALHALGIVHGGVNKHNFLVADGPVTLVGFECARKCEDVSVFLEEFASLAERLDDMSGKGETVLD